MVNVLWDCFSADMCFALFFVIARLALVISSRFIRIREFKRSYSNFSLLLIVDSNEVAFSSSINLKKLQAASAAL